MLALSLELTSLALTLLIRDSLIQTTGVSSCSALLYILESGGRGRVCEKLNKIGGSVDFSLRISIVINQISHFAQYEIC